MKYLITHDGYPHADDILAYALLSTVYPEWKLVRTRDESIINMPEDCEDKIVFDVGMKFDAFHFFDHHQKEKKMRDEIIPFSAFGLIWRKALIPKISSLKLKPLRTKPYPEIRSIIL